MFGSLRMPMFAVIAASLFLFSTSGSAARAGRLSCRETFAAEPTVRVFSASKSMSQKVRDNAPDYWRYAGEDGRDYFGDLLAFQGLVVGDTHTGNFIISPLAGRLQFFIADIKDAGRAPYILDFARLALSTQVVFRGDEVKTKETVGILLDAYMKGLRGEPMNTSKKVHALFKETLEDYLALAKAYVSKKTKHDRFKLREGKLEALPAGGESRNPGFADRLRKDIATALHSSDPGAEILDLAVRPRERGGSVDHIRYWALVRGADLETSIVEFKHIGEPATANYEVQAPTPERYAKVMQVFWQTEDPAYRVVRLDGSWFQMRPKKVDLFRVPYKQKKKSDVEFLFDLSSFAAHYLGTLHARQQTDSKYLSAIAKDPKALQKSLKQFIRDYSEHLDSEISQVEAEEEDI